VINRLGVIAGPGQFGKVDQGVFTYWLLAHYFKKDLDYIGFGGEGKQVRDLLHVDDLFELIDLEINSLDRINGRIYNAGGSRGVSLSLLEATQECSRITGNCLKIGKVLKERPGDIKIYLTDNRKVNEDLSWKPKRSAVRVLSDTYRWIRAYEKLLKQSLF
jgi:CDP-paratose 2-epimerase